MPATPSAAPTNHSPETVPPPSNAAPPAEIAPWGYVTVLGQVNDPGQVPLGSPAGIRLSEAIRLSGGFANQAKLREIRLTRFDPKNGDQRETIDFMGRNQGIINADFTLKKGDIIYIPARSSP